MVHTILTSLGFEIKDCSCLLTRRINLNCQFMRSLRVFFYSKVKKKYHKTQQKEDRGIKIMNSALNC